MKEQKALTALKKAGSLLKIVQDMMEKGKYCIDIIQQNLAVIGLLKSANESLLEGHLHHCFKSAMKSSNESKQEEMIEELLKVMKTAQKK